MISEERLTFGFHQAPLPQYKTLFLQNKNIKFKTPFLSLKDGNGAAM